MDLNARESYLETQVMTATPQKARLMLIDGALRFVNQTLHLWNEERQEEAFDSLVRGRDIISELLTTAKQHESEVNEKTAAIYAFMFQTLTEAQLHKDSKKLEEVIRILEIERETWRQVCEKMPEAPDPELRKQFAPKEITASNSVAIPPQPMHVPPAIGGSGESNLIPAPLPAPVQPPTESGGFSLDA